MKRDLSRGNERNLSGGMDWWSYHWGRGLSGERNALIMVEGEWLLLGWIKCTLIRKDGDISPNRGENRRYLSTGRNRGFHLKWMNEKIPLSIVRSLLKEK